ncbi:MAG: ABC transporter substrate-binding protein [Haloarculaceae archaeon]
MAADDKPSVVDLRSGDTDTSRRSFLTKAGTTLGAGTLFSAAGCVSDEQGPETTESSGGGESTEGGGGGNTETEASSSGPKRGGKLTIVNDLLFELLDQRRSSIMNIASMDIFDYLVTRDYQGRFAPGLATDWSFENDNEDIVLSLRKGVTFHDGTKFDAEHVKWFLTDFLANGSGTAYLVESLDDVVVDDTHTARLKLKKPDPNIIWNLSSEWGAVHSKKAVQENGDSYGQNVAVGSGPFKLKSRSGDKKMVLERFEDYDWGPDWVGIDGSARPKTVEYRVITETATMTGAFEAGDVDVIEHATPYQRVKTYKNDDRFEFKPQPAVNVINHMMFNLNPETNPAPIVAEDVALRKAMSYALDRKAIVQGIYSESAIPATNYLPPAVPSHDVPTKHNYNYDLERAKQVMKDAGWEVNPGGVSTKDGKKAKFTVVARNKSSEARRATSIASMWHNNIGVKANVKTLDTATFKKEISNGNATAWLDDDKWANADLLWWWNSSDMMGEWYRHTRAPKQFPKVDEYINAAMNAQTWEERIKKFKRAHIYLLDNVVPMVPEVYPIKGDTIWNYIENYGSHYQAAPKEPVWNENW